MRKYLEPHERCEASVYAGIWFRPNQCERRWKVKEKDGKQHCTQHSYAKIAERDKASQERYRQRMDTLNRPYRIRVAYQEAFEDLEKATTLDEVRDILDKTKERLDAIK